MNVSSDMKNQSHIVHWQEIVKDDFMDEFVKVVKASHYTGRAGFLSTEAAVKKIMDGMKPENKDKYLDIRFSMRECGYYYDKAGIWHVVGWTDDTWIDDKGNLKFYTTAPGPMVFISMASFMEAKEEHKRDTGKVPLPPPGPLAPLLDDFIHEPDAWES